MADDQPDVDNVLFVLTDQQRLDSLGCYGNEHVETPNLDRLAERGTRYERTYTPAAICGPARASIVSGVRPHEHGILRNPEEADVGDISDRFPCYPQLLREEGYNVGLAGKWHLGNPPGDYGFDGEHYPGWFYPENHPDYEAYLEERGFPEMTADHLVDRFPDDWEEFQAGAMDDRPVEATFTRFVTERAIEQLDEYAEDYPETPFYQSVHYYGPHNPYYLPEEYWTMYDPEEIDLPESAIRETLEGKPWVHKVQRDVSSLDEIDLHDWRRIIAAYWGYVSFIDDEVGRLLDALEERGLREDTAVVFTSDHGGFVTAHKMHDKGPAMYEDIYNVPFITDGFGNDRDVEDRFASLLDLAPTFLDVAGVDVPDVYTGRSLLDLQRDDADWREDVLAEFHGHQFPYEQRMLRADQYKLVLNQHDTAELYDLEEDPHEIENRIDDPEYGDVAERLHSRLRERLDEEGDTLFQPFDSKLSGTIHPDEE